MPVPHTGSVIFSGSEFYIKKHEPTKVQQAHVSIATGIKPASSNVTCNFCRGNGERPVVYNSHALRDTDRNLTCPVLRSYVCPQCGGTGDTAHTLSYCPWTKEKSVAKAIKQQAGRNSMGLKKK
ncbi:NANOS2 [Bugula neritina]|uniref:NANOS2 n=1 Tax=Bugula neritina TaxID=10212 RepID=A0A7J7KF71_BUGNE|nr:NANOS2 [Bugula neritina]